MRLGDGCLNVDQAFLLLLTYILEDTLHIITLYTLIAGGYVQTMILKVIWRLAVLSQTAVNEVPG
jgi:hypothetical protein